jgi:hypothetical protein
MPDKPALPGTYYWIVRNTPSTGEVHVCIAFGTVCGGPHVEDRVTMNPEFINKHIGVGQERFDNAILTVMNQMAAKLYSRLDIEEWVKRWQ